MLCKSPPCSASIPAAALPNKRTSAIEAFHSGIQATQNILSSRGCNTLQKLAMQRVHTGRRAPNKRVSAIEAFHSGIPAIAKTGPLLRRISGSTFCWAHLTKRAAFAPAKGSGRLALCAGFCPCASPPLTILRMAITALKSRPQRGAKNQIRRACRRIWFFRLPRIAFGHRPTRLLGRDAVALRRVQRRFPRLSRPYPSSLTACRPRTDRAASPGRTAKIPARRFQARRYRRFARQTRRW